MCCAWSEWFRHLIISIQRNQICKRNEKRHPKNKLEIILSERVGINKFSSLKGHIVQWRDSTEQHPVPQIWIRLDWTNISKTSKSSKNWTGQMIKRIIPWNSLMQICTPTYKNQNFLPLSFCGDGYRWGRKLDSFEW